MNSREQTGATSSWYVPDYIHPLLHDGGIVYLNERSGEWTARNRIEATTALKAAGLLSTVGADLRWPELPALKKAPIISSLVERLTRDGLLATGVGPKASFTYGEMPEAGSLIVAREPAPQLPSIPRSVERAAAEGLAQAVQLTSRSDLYQDMVDHVRAARHNTAPASVSHIRYIAETVYQLEDRFNGRVACLERTVAVALAAAQLGMHVDVQLGTTVDPITYHAWPEVNGQAIQIEGEMSSEQHYPLFTI